MYNEPEDTKSISMLWLLLLLILPFLAILVDVGYSTSVSTPQTAITPTSAEIKPIVLTSRHYQLTLKNNAIYELRVDSTLDYAGCDGLDVKDDNGMQCILMNKDDIILFMGSIGVHISQQ